MQSNSATPPQPPSSPDSLERGVRGKITGVTRIGPRALGLGAVILFLVFALILAGASKPNKARAGAADANVAFAAPAPQDTGHFGANVPIVDPDSHTTQSLPVTQSAAAGNRSKGINLPAGLVLPSTPPPAAPDANGAPQTNGASGTVPNIETAGAQTNAAPAQLQVAPPAVDPVAEAKLERARAAEQAREQKAAERAQEMQLAYQAPVVIGGSDGGPRPLAASPGTGASVAETSGAQSTLAQNGATGAANGGVNAAAANSPIAPTMPAGSGAAPAPAASGNPNAFLSGPFGHGAVPQGGTANANDYLDAQRYAARSKYEVVASSVIPAALITGIDSEQPGLISAQVRQDVFDSRTGRYLLIPKGSRLIGTYKNDVQAGQSRVLVAWQRLIFPDTSSIDLHDQVGADTEGYSGLGGKVDDHFAGVFATALLSSVLSAGLQLSQPQAGVAVATGVVAPSTGQMLAGAAGQQISQVGSMLAQKEASLPPVIHVPRGYPFLVVVDHDMVFPSPYQGAGQ